MRSYFPLIGRILISQIFILNSIKKMLDFEGSWQYMDLNGIPMAPLLLIGAILVEFAGGLSILFGFQTKLGALLLILFLIPTTLIFHLNFEDAIQSTNFFKNISLIGGLFFLLYHGAGPIAVDPEVK